MLKKYITKIEGHGTLKVDLIKRNAHITIDEGERLIEGIILGRNYNDAPFVTSRICGVCPIAHNLTSILAIENAFTVKTSNITNHLRNILLNAQIIQSHTLHLYFLAISDYYGKSSTLELAKTKPEIFEHGLQLKKLADLIVKTVGGRAVHPISSVVGGFTQIPSLDELKDIKKVCLTHLDIAKNTAKTFSKFNYPKLNNITNYLALTSHQGYSLVSDVIESSNGQTFKNNKYTKNIVEKVIDCPAKVSTYKDKPFLVGALSRIVLKSQRLNPIAKENYKKLKNNLGNFPSFNSFHNNFSQSIEIIHCLEEIIKTIDHLTKIDYKYTPIPNIKPKASIGFATVEAPRGLLYHFYEIDKNGNIKNCNIITPTAQSLNNLQSDINSLVEQSNKTNDKELIKDINMLIRAYDPCITCSVH